MKRLFFNAMMAAAILTSSAMLASCSKDDNDEPEPIAEEQPTNNPAVVDNNNTDNNTSGGTTNGGTTNGGTTNVTPPNETPAPTFDYSKVACLNGSNYYIFRLNEPAYDYLEANKKVAANLDVNEVDTKFYIWENTYSISKMQGTDCFGADSEGGLTSIGGNGTWCGGGWCRLTEFDYSKIDASYTLHISLRCNKSSNDWYMAFNSPDLNGKEYKITPESVDLNGNAFDLNTKGEWKEFEFSIGDMIDAGVNLTNFDGSKGINFPCYGGFLGATVDIDALFIYKKN